MAAIEPAEIKDYSGKTVHKYNLPKGSSTDLNQPLLMLDTSVEGYNAEWLTSIGVTEFKDILEEYATHGVNATATFEPGCRSNFRAEGSLEAILSDYSNFYPGECSYLRLEEPEYDIGWERWEGQNSVVFSSETKETKHLENYFTEIILMDRPRLERLVEESLNQAHQILNQGS